LKKIDLHIHIVPTISDADFTLSLNVFQRYAKEASLDAVAVTNHDVFDGDQFKLIQGSLDAKVSPFPLFLTCHPQTGGCRVFHGFACSSWLASRNNVASSLYRPVNIMPMGSRSFDQPSGSESEGWPVTLKGGV